MADTTRICKTCGEPKPLTEYYLARGLPRGSCKECARSEARANYHAKREARLAKGREYRETNREALRAAAREWYRQNKEKSRLASLRWSRANPEYYREYNKRWYQENRELRIQQIANYHAANYEDRLRRNREHLSRRRARMAGAQVVPFTTEQLAARIAFYGGVCWICRAAPYEELDHVKPVKAGGPHMLANLRPACRSCNASKNATWPLIA